MLIAHTDNILIQDWRQLSAIQVRNRMEIGRTKFLKCIDELIVCSLLNGDFCQGGIRLVLFKLRGVLSHCQQCKYSIICEFLSHKTQVSNGLD